MSRSPSTPNESSAKSYINHIQSYLSHIFSAAEIEEWVWREALEEVGGPDNPEKLWPVLANGFKDLAARLKIQARSRNPGNPETRRYPGNPKSTPF